MANGEIVWKKAFPGGHPLIISSSNGDVLILESGTLYHVDMDGEVILRLAITNSGETFEALPVIDSNGKVYVAGAEKLYIIE